MDKKLIQEFYSLINRRGNLATISEIQKLSEAVPAHRADLLQKEIKDYSPFTRAFRYRPNYLLYEGYKDDDCSYKIDIIFEETGSVRIMFWDPERRSPSAVPKLRKKLRQIGYSKDFSVDGHVLTHKVEAKGFQNLQRMDAALFAFVTKFMAGLRASNVAR